jgi:hypothetical protein
MTRDEQEHLEFWHASNPGCLPINKGPVKITRAGVTGVEWRGPIMVVRKYCSEDKKTLTYLDMEPLDVRHTADYFTAFLREGHDKFSNVFTMACLAVCPGDEFNRLGLLNWRVEYGPRPIDARDPIFQCGSSDIATCIGIPLLIRKDVVDQHYDVTPESRALYGNEKAMLLKRDLHSLTTAPGPSRQSYMEMRALAMALPRDQLAQTPVSVPRNIDNDGEFGFGSSPALWCGYIPVQNIIVARADGLPLFDSHLEATCEYITQEVEPKLKAAVAGLKPGSMIPNREEILASINKVSFLAFYARYQSTKSFPPCPGVEVSPPFEVKSNSVSKAYTKFTMGVQRDGPVDLNFDRWIF